MNATIKLFLKMFLFTGISFALLSLLIDPREEGVRWVGILIKGGFFGFFISAPFVIFQVWALRAEGVREITDDVLKVKQSKTVQSNISLLDIVKRIEADPELGKSKWKLTPDHVEIKTKINWSSWGEIVDIHLKRKAPDRMEYEVTSRPKLSTTFVDGARNLKNVNRVLKLMT